jgi:c-di-GMP-related signal transduction protein
MTPTIETEAALSVLLGRQPILDRAGALVAYELLFRGGAADTACVIDDHAATEQVILNAIAQFGVAGALGPHRGFVNIGRASLDADVLLLLEPGRFTLELLEHVVLDAEVEAALFRMQAAGFQIALDDVTALDRIPARVLALVDVVKIDLRETPAADWAGLIHAIHAAGCRVLAEKVETRREFRQLLDLGADLFQGYFFARPEILRQSPISASQAALLKFSQMLASDPTLVDLQSEVKRSPVLLAQLMKFAGSASAAGRQDLTVGEAIARVGTRQLNRLVQLLLFASEGRDDLADDPLLQLVHARACFMESMARELAGDDDDFADMAFQTGIFSLMHVVTRQTRAQLLQQLGTSPRIAAAILRSEGRLGDLLLIAEHMEGFEAASAAPALARCRIDFGRLSALFTRATQETLSSP